VRRGIYQDSPPLYYVRKLHGEGLNTPEQNNPQFLIEVFIKKAVMPGGAAEKRIVHLHQPLLRRFIPCPGKEQYLLKIHHF